MNEQQAQKVAGPQTQTEKTVGELQIGDRVLGNDGKQHKVTGIGAWGGYSRFLSLDGKPDGAYLRAYRVQVAP
jgi:hypothetical protein